MARRLVIFARVKERNIVNTLSSKTAGALSGATKDSSKWLLIDTITVVSRPLPVTRLFRP